MVVAAGVYLERLTWPEAAAQFERDPLIVIPIGAAAKEHGPHLPLGTDHLLADYFAARVAEHVSCVVAPAVTYGYYPSFADFPGSTHLEARTFGAMVREIVLSLYRHGPRRFLILNTGISTFPVLEIVARDLRRGHSLLVGVTRIEDLGGRALDGLLEQSAGSHADEYETSVMLVIAPKTVRREQAVREIPKRLRITGLFVPAQLPRTVGRPRADGHPEHQESEQRGSGVYGDATVATHEKGKRILAAVAPNLIAAAEYLRTSAMD